MLKSSKHLCILFFPLGFTGAHPHNHARLTIPILPVIHAILRPYHPSFRPYSSGDQTCTPFLFSPLFKSYSYYSTSVFPTNTLSALPQTRATFHHVCFTGTPKTSGYPQSQGSIVSLLFNFTYSTLNFTHGSFRSSSLHPLLFSGKNETSPSARGHFLSSFPGDH